MQIARICCFRSEGQFCGSNWDAFCHLLKAQHRSGLAAKKTRVRGSKAVCTDWKEAPNQTASAFNSVKAQSLAISPQQAADGALFMS